MVEGLERRTVLAANFYVAPAADFTITLDQGAPGLDAGDTVSWNGATPVTGLVLGTDAFTTIQAAINAAPQGSTVNVAAGTFVEQLNLDGRVLTLLGAQATVAAGRHGDRNAESIFGETIVVGTSHRVNATTNIAVAGFVLDVDAPFAGSSLFSSEFSTSVRWMRGATLLLENNVIKTTVAGTGNGWNLLSTDSHSAPITFRANTISGFNRIFLEGSSTSGLNTFTFTGNAMLAQEGRGSNFITVQGSNRIPGGILVHDNLFVGGGLTGTGGAILSLGNNGLDDVGHTITDNVFRNGIGSGIALFASGINNTITGNDFSDYPARALGFAAAATKVSQSTIANNLFGAIVSQVPPVVTVLGPNRRMTAGVEVAYDTITLGTAAADALAGGPGSSLVFGFDGDDTLAATAGTNLLDGGGGVDTAVFSGTAADYTITLGPTTVTVTSKEGFLPASVSTLVSIEKLSFTSQAGTTLVVGPGSVYATIQAAIDAATVGDTILVLPGTYAENLSVGKPLTIIGAGSGDDPATSTIVTAAAAGSPTIGYTAGGADAANRQTLRNVRVTGASGGTGNNNSGILLSGGSKGFFTFDNVAAVGNTGSGMVSNVSPATSTLTDVVIVDSTFSNNGSNGIRTASHSVDGFSVTDTEFRDNAALGLGFNTSDNTTAQIGGVTLTNVTFAGNSSVADLYAFRMLGTMALTNVHFLGSNGSGLFGLYLLGGYVNQDSAPAIAAVTLDDVTVAGTYTSAGISFLGYSNLANVSLTDVVLDTAVPTANRGHLRLSGVAGTLDLGNTAFNTATSAFDVVMNNNFGAAGSKSTVAVDATAATFSGKTGAAMTLPERFAAQNRMIDVLDGTLTGADGLVTFVADNLFVTAANARVQPAFAVASPGDTIWIEAGAGYPAPAVVAAVDNLTVDVPAGVGAFTAIELDPAVARLTITGDGGIDLGGNDLANELVGNDGPNVLLGEADDDTLTGNGGDDAIDGGTGLDTAVYAGDYADYTIIVTGSGPEAVITVIDDRPGSPDGTDTLTNVERLRFADRTVNPLGFTLAITSSASTLKAGETAEISFLLSDASTDFTADDVVVTGGTLSDFSGAGAAYTATFTPEPGFVGTATVTVPAGAFTDDVGTPNAEAVLTPPITVDTIAPTLVITASAATIRFGESVTLAFALSKPAVGFEAAAVEVTGGTLSEFTMLTSTAYTAVFTPLGTFIGAGTVVVPAGAFTDAAGNPNLAASLTPALEIDTVQPTVTITSDRGTLAAGQTAVITFSLSQPAPGFAARNVDVSGGSLAPLSALDATTFTGVFTPTPGFRGAGTVSVAAGAFTAASGNPNLAGSLAAPLVIVTERPSVTIVTDATTLLFGETAGLTFVLSEPAGDFSADSVVVTGGTLTEFAGAGSLYTATFVPTKNFRGSGTVVVPQAAFSDAFGNPNRAGSLQPAFTIDTVRPRVTVTASTDSLVRGTTATISFSLSQSSTTFTPDVVIVTGGTLQNFSGGGRRYTATFVPSLNVVGAGTIDVPAASFVGDTGNPNVAGGLATPFTIDTVRPSVTITADRASLARGETTTITIEVGRPTTAFRVSQVAVTGGTLSNFSGGGTSYTAVFTPLANFTGSGTISVPANAFRSTAGNLNVAGSLADPLTIDTVRPTVRITSSVAKLRAGRAAAITFTLGRPSTDFTIDDVTVRGGTLSDFTGSGSVYTAVFTPLDDFAGAGAIEVAARAFTSTTGNPNVAGSLAPVISIDTVRPTVAITAQRTSLGAGGTSLISFALDRPSTTFRPEVITVSGGTLSQFRGSGRSYTALFTPLTNFTGEGTVTVAAESFRSSSGNPNRFSALAAPLVIDTVRPSVTISSSLTALGPGETATITFLLSRPATSFTAVNVTVRGGTLSGFTGSGSSFTATFVPQPAFRGQGTINVAAGSFTGPTGSRNRAGAMAVPIEIDTLVTVAAAGLEAGPPAPAPRPRLLR
jgi:hypothetical protein